MLLVCTVIVPLLTYLLTLGTLLQPVLWRFDSSYMNRIDQVLRPLLSSRDDYVIPGVSSSSENVLSNEVLSRVEVPRSNSSESTDQFVLQLLIEQVRSLPGGESPWIWLIVVVICGILLEVGRALVRVLFYVIVTTIVTIIDSIVCSWIRYVSPNACGCSRNTGPLATLTTTSSSPSSSECTSVDSSDLPQAQVTASRNSSSTRKSQTASLMASASSSGTGNHRRFDRMGIG